MVGSVALYIIGIIAGLLGLWYASEHLVSACLIIAERFKLNTLVIGALFMALVTGLPELLLSIMSILNNAAQLSVGDIMGSNLIDTAVVVGFTALVAGPIIIEKEQRSYLLLLLVLSALTMFGLFYISTITPLVGVGLVFSYIILIAILWIIQKPPRVDEVEAVQAEEVAKPFQRHIVMYAFGHFVLLTACTQLALYSAKLFATTLQLPLELLGATIFAVATSLPEFVISIHAARRGAHGLILGNAFGAALQQGLFTLGILGIFSATTVSVAPVASLIVYFVVGFTLLAGTILVGKVSRVAGGALVSVGIFYVVYEALQFI